MSWEWYIYLAIVGFVTLLIVGFCRAVAQANRDERDELRRRKYLSGGDE